MKEQHLSILGERIFTNHSLRLASPASLLIDLLFFLSIDKKKNTECIINDENSSNNKYLHDKEPPAGVESVSCLNWTFSMNKIDALLNKSGTTHVAGDYIPPVSVNDDCIPIADMDNDADFLEVSQMTQESLDAYLLSENIDIGKANKRLDTFIDDLENPNIQDLEGYRKERLREKLIQETGEKTVSEVISDLINSIKLLKDSYQLNKAEHQSVFEKQLICSDSISGSLHNIEKAIKRSGKKIPKHLVAQNNMAAPMEKPAVGNPVFVHIKSISCDDKDTDKPLAPKQPKKTAAQIH